MKYDVWSSLILVGLPSLQYHASTSPPTASWLDMALFQIVVEHWRVLTSAWSCLMSFVCKLMTHIMCDTINSESMSLFCSAIGQVDKSRVVIGLCYSYSTVNPKYQHPTLTNSISYFCQSDSTVQYCIVTQSQYFVSIMMLAHWILSSPGITRIMHIVKAPTLLIHIK